VEWAALVVAIFSALGAATAAYFAYVANRTSSNANKLAREANDIAAQAHQQAERSFLESGSLVEVDLAWRGAFVIRVMSTGRLPAVVHRILLECDSVEAARQLPRAGSNPAVPLALEPTRQAEFVLDKQVLATVSGRYGGRHVWRVAAELGDGRAFWSNAVEVVHPDEPTVQQMLDDVCGAALDLVKRVRRRSADSEAGWNAYHRLRAQLARVESRYDDLSFRPGTMATQIVNARRNLTEVRTTLEAATSDDPNVS
jgi:hypothetical protein